MKQWILVLVFLAGCSRDPVVGTGRFGALKHTSQNRLWVSTTDQEFSTGGLSLVFLNEGRVQSVPIDCRDPFVRPIGKGAISVNRGDCSNLQSFAGDLTLGGQISVGKDTNPQDVFALGDGSAYVTRFNQNSLARIDLKTGSVLDAIDFSRYADADGIPDMTLMRAQGSELFVQLQRILIDDKGLHTTDKSSVGVVDLTTRQTTGDFAFEFKNPTTDFKGVSPAKWLVGFNGEYAVRDGGIQAWNPQRKASLGKVATEASLKGELVDFDWLDEKSGLVILVSDGKTRLSPFSLVTGLPGVPIIQSEGYDLRQVIIDRERDLVYVADRTKERPGIRVWDATTLRDTGNFVSLALPPFHMELAP